MSNDSIMKRLNAITGEEDQQEPFKGYIVGIDLGIGQDKAYALQLLIPSKDMTYVNR